MKKRVLAFVVSALVILVAGVLVQLLSAIGLATAFGQEQHEFDEDSGRTNLFVDAAAPLGGDGSREHPFARITDAVERARAVRQEDDDKEARDKDKDDDKKKRIVIHVLPGTYVGSYTKTGAKIEPLPIRLDVSDLELIGSTSMASDEGGLPTGVIEPGSETLLRADPPLVDFPQTLLLAGSMTDGVVVERVTIAKLSLDSSRLGDSFFVDRVQGFTIRDNYLTGGFTDIYRSSGQVLGNYLTGTGEGILVGAGNPSSPARVLVSGNRSVKSRNGGLLLSGSTYSRLPGESESLSAVACGNDLSDNGAANQLQGFGLRIIVMIDPTSPDTTSGSVTATICNNRIRNNHFGVVIDAGFPSRARNSIPDPRQYTGTYHLTFEDNDIGGNKRTPALITFTRSTSSLSPSQLDGTACGTALGCYKYLQDSIFDITYTTGELDGFWFDHPEIEPIDGRTLENVLRINGEEIPNGRFVPFI